MGEIGRAVSRNDALPEERDAFRARGHGIAGTPRQARHYVGSVAEAADVGYFDCDFAFGTSTTRSHDSGGFVREQGDACFRLNRQRHGSEAA